MSNEWYWEGNVVKAVSAYLQKEGWTVKRTANTETREAGVDIHAQKSSEVLLVEVKGYPSTVYERGERKGQPKRTNPPTQARHWYGEVLFSAILRQAEHPTATVAIALPKFTPFTNLVRRMRHALTKLGIVVYVVEDSGTVKVISPTDDK